MLKMAIQVNTQSVDFGDVFRVNDLSDGEKFKLSLECGEFFGPGDVRVKVLAEQNRLVIEGSRIQRTGDVQVSRQISYEHELPDGVETSKLKAGWDPNEDVLIVEAPLSGQADS